MRQKSAFVLNFGEKSWKMNVYFISPLTQHGHKPPISRAADSGHCCILGNKSEVTAGSEVTLYSLFT